MSHPFHINLQEYLKLKEYRNQGFSWEDISKKDEFIGFYEHQDVSAEIIIYFLEQAWNSYEAHSTMNNWEWAPIVE